MSQGVVQTPRTATQMVTSDRRARSRDRRGPVASQIAIKQLGTNGGGFFNVNSAHPFENPTPLSNFLEMFAILLHPGGAHLHVRQDGRQRRGRAGRSSPPCGSCMVVGLVITVPGERDPATAGDAGGRHLRQPPAATWRARRSASAWRRPRSGRSRPPTPRTAASTRCTTPTSRSAGSLPMFNIAIGEVIFGGVGSRPVRHARSTSSSPCSSAG